LCLGVTRWTMSPSKSLVENRRIYGHGIRTWAWLHGGLMVLFEGLL
jgi:hypothetical protein